METGFDKGGFIRTPSMISRLIQFIKSQHKVVASPWILPGPTPLFSRVVTPVFKTPPFPNLFVSITQTVFDTDVKLEHAHMVQYCVTSSIKEGHSLPVCDVQWLPDHIDICHKTFQVLEGDGVTCNQIISCSIDG